MSQTEKKHSSRASTDNNQTSRNSRSSKMSYGGSISDIEADDESDKYRKMAKKLARDKSELKDKLRRLLDEVDQKTHEHRVELEKTQDYFQDQINELVEERDKVREEMEVIREAVLEEKEKLREQYEQKLSKQKESLEKRYGGKDSQVVKRLENTIATLQERLNKQMEEREHVKDTAEQFYAEKEEQLRKTVAELEDQLQKAKEQHIKDRKDLQMLTKTFTDEKEQIVRKMRQEKNDEVFQITSEKNSTVMALQNIKEQLEKRTQDLDHKRDGLIAQAKQQAEQVKINAERDRAEFVKNCKKTMDEFKQEHEHKFAVSETNYKMQIEKMVKEHEKIVQNLTAENSKKISLYMENTRRETEDYKKTISALQTELTNVTEKCSNIVQKKEEEVKKAIERCNFEYHSRYEEKDREINDLRLKNDKISGESEETIQRLKEQLNLVRENMKKVQDNSQAMNNQFVSNLNKQKELADKEISVRDQTIGHLEYQVKKIGEESIDRFNMLDRKARHLSEENKEVTDKYNNMKSLTEKQEEIISGLRIEVQKLKENMLCMHEQHRQDQFTVGMNEQKLKLELEQKKHECEFLGKGVEEMKSKMAILSQTCASQKTQIGIVTENLEKHVQNLGIRDREITSLNKSLSVANGELGRLKKIYSDELHQKILEVKTDRDRQVEDLSRRLATYGVTVANLEQSRVEMRQNIVALSIERDKYKTIAETIVEKDKALENAVKKVTGIEEHMHTLEQSKQQTEHKLQLLQSKHKLLEESFSKDLEAKNREVQKLQEDIVSVKNSYGGFLANINAENKSKDDEIKFLRDKITEYQVQEARMAELSNTVGVLQNSHRVTLEKIAEEKKSEGDKMAKKVFELERKLAERDQDMEKIKQEYNKKLTDMTKIPQECKTKMEEYEKENGKLSVQLEASEKKLYSLQAEYAQILANVRSKQEHLREREEELKKAERTFREAPPRLMDPSIRKARDDALANLRQAKIELTKTKDDTIQVTQKLAVAEGLIKDLEREKHLILKSQSDLKETFVNNLNHQQEKHEREMTSKNERIKELEIMLTEKLSKRDI